MRSALRAAGLLFVAAVAITCTDAPTGPGTLNQSAIVPGRISMAPSFTPEAARIFGKLASLGLEVTEVRVRLTGADGITRDTVIAFPPGQDQLVIEIAVPMSGTDQPFNALIELRNDQHQVLFSGTQTVIARAAHLPPLNPPVVTISYTGPGVRTRTVTVSPPDTTVLANAAIPFSATAVDSSGAAVTDLLVGWTISDLTLGTITQGTNRSATITGLGKRGVATVTASTPLGVTGSSRVTFVPPATRIVVIGGGGQTGVAGSALLVPMVVEVQAADNLPVPSARVNFRSLTTGGSVQVATAIADGNGRASTLMTLGRTAGAYQYEASTGTLPAVTVTNTATPAPAAAIAIVSGNGQVDSVLRALPLPLVVKVTDQFGGDVSGAAVTWTRVAGNGALSAASSATGANGTASITYTLGTTPSSDTVRASVAGVATPVFFSLRAINRAPADIAITAGGIQSGAPNTTLPTALVARVRDAQGNPVIGTTVTWSVGGAGVTFATPTSLTDNAGLATTAVTLGAAAGTSVVTATAGSVSTTTQLTTLAGAAASITKTAGDAQTVPVATAVAVAPSVTIKDAANNPVPNATVVFAVASGGGSVAGGTTTTNASGVATVGSWTLGGVAGLNSLTATSGALTATFTATGTAATPSTFAFVPALPGSITVGAGPTTIGVRLVDAQGNFVQQGGTVITGTSTVQPGNLVSTFQATTNATGTATFTWPTFNTPVGSVTFSMSAPSFTTLNSAAIPLVAGAPSKLLISVQPGATAASGSPLAPQPVVQLADAGGNAVAVANVSVTAAVSAGTATLAGAATQQTDATGKAMFTNLALTGTPGANTLQFTSGTLTPVSANPVTLGAGAAASMVAITPVTQAGAAGAPALSPPGVRVTDAAGNPVAGVGINFGIGAPAGSGASVSDGVTTGQAVIINTNAAGIAQLSAWNLRTIAGANTVSAVAQVSPSINTVSFSATGTAGAATRLALVNPVPASITVGQTFTPVPAQLLDANNNPVAQGGVVITATGNVQPSNTTFALQATTDSTGTANFQPLPYTGRIGTLVFTLTAPSVTPLVTSGINVLAGPAARLVITTHAPAATTSGATLSPQPAIQVADVGSNPVSAAGINVLATLLGGGTLGGTNTATTNASGLASFTNLAITSTVGVRNLQYSATSLASVADTVQVTAGSLAFFDPVAGNGQTAPVATTLPVNPSVSAKDAAGNALAGVPVTFTVTGGGGTITGGSTMTNASGIATLGAWTLGATAGTNTVSATSGTSQVSFTANGVAGPAAIITKTVGDGQSAAAGTQVPTAPQVRVTDANGNPVSGVSVTFTVASGGGSVTSPTQVTNVSGFAGVGSWTLGNTVGPNSLTATAGALTTTFNATGIAGAAAAISKNAGDAQSATVATSVAIAPQVLIRDAAGNPVAGAPVTFAVVLGGGTVFQPSVTTNASGLATVGAWTLGNTAGPNSLTATSGSLTTTFTATGTVGAASQIAKNAGDAQSATAGTQVTVAPQVLIRDANGNPIAGAPVTFTVSNGGGSITGPSTTTNASGLASVGSWTLGATAGPNALMATSGSLTTTFTATGTAGAATRFVLAGPLPSAFTVGITPSAFSLQLVDAQNNPVAQAGVNANAAVTVLPSNAVFGASATTSASGLVTFALPAYVGQVGTATIVVTSPSLTQYTSPGIPVNPGNAASLRIAQQPSANVASGAALATQPGVQAIDVGGNDAAGAGGFVINASIASGPAGALGGSTSATTNAAGLATFATLSIGGPAGAYTLRFANSGNTITSPTTNTITVGPGGNTVLSVNAGNGQTGPVSQALATAPSVIVRDQFNNPVPGVAVTFNAGAGGSTVSSGGGQVTSASVNTNALGVASLTNWTMGATAQPYSLTVTAAVSSGSPLTFTATAVSGAATRFQLLSVLPVGWSVGAVPPAFQFQLVDAQGNAVQQSGVTVTAVLTVQPSNQSVSNTGVTDASGIRAVSFPAYIGTQGTGTFTVAATGLTTYTSPSIAITPGPAAALKIITQPGSTVAAGAALSPQPAVQLIDVGGNNVSQGGVVVVASIASGTGGTLGGSTALGTNTAGQALFTDLSIGGQAGPFTLGFANSGNTIVSPATNTIAVGQGTNSTMVVNAGNAQTGTVAQPLATAPSVLVRDQFNNPIPGINVTFNTGTNGSTVSNGGAQLSSVTVATNTSGIAAVTNWTMGNSSGFYSMTVTATVTTGSPLTFTATANPPAAASLTVQSGARTLTQPSTNVSSGVITFSVRDAANNPMPNGTVVNFSSNNTNCAVPSSATTSLGTASVGVTVGGVHGGCEITATSGSLSATAQLAVRATGATHVWFGGAAGQTHAFDLGANWIEVATGGQVAPTATTHRPYIPRWTDGTLSPSAQSNRTYAGIIMDASSSLDLQGVSFTFLGDVAAPQAAILNGVVQATGTNTNVSGIFSTLGVGSVVSCGGAAPQRSFLREVSVVQQMTVFCDAQVDSIAGVTTLVTRVGSKLTVHDGGALSVSDTASFLGDSLRLIGTAGVVVGGKAVVGGGLAADSLSTMYFGNDATFNGTSSAAFGHIHVVGNVTFGGFASTQYSLGAGGLTLSGTFTQAGTGAAFVAAPAHMTTFTGGAAAQTISFAAPTSSLFGNVRINPGSDVTILSNVNQSFGNVSTNVDIYGKLTVPVGRTWSTGGFVFANTGSTTTVNGAINPEVFSCNGGAVGGTGTINGTPASQRCVIQ